MAGLAQGERSPAICCGSGKETTNCSRLIRGLSYGPVNQLHNIIGQCSLLYSATSLLAHSSVAAAGRRMASPAMRLECLAACAATFYVLIDGFISSPAASIHCGNAGLLARPAPACGGL